MSNSSQPHEPRPNSSQPHEPQTHETEPVPSVAPTLRLSRGGLILCLALMVGTGLTVYSIFPDSVGGPPLPVEVQLDTRLVATVGGQGALPAAVVVVRNLADHAIPKLSIDINGQYLLFRDSPLEIGEEFVVPQRVFTDKRSSQRFDPSNYDVEDILVTGQLPSGARGVSKFDFHDEGIESDANE